MKLNTTPRVGINDPQLTRELRNVATAVNLLADGRLAGTNNASTAAPTTGTHALGDFVRNSNPTGTAPIIGWTCTAGGTPGTWVAQYGGISVGADHGALTGLADDDHAQYHNDARGDARYVALTGNQTVAGEKTFTDPTVIAGSSASAMLRVTQTGAGNAIEVEDSTSPDATPFVVNASGAVGIGTTSLTGFSLRISRSMTGGTSGYGAHVSGTVQSDVTSAARGITSTYGTQATAFTLTNLYQFIAEQGTIGEGSTVTSQHGFHAASTLTGATNNYGFYGNIASGAGRWNFYGAGTAANYLNGDLRIGTTTQSGSAKLTVSGEASATSFTGAGTGLTGTGASFTAGTATNVAGGAANRIAYQTGAGATGFIVAPTVASTYLRWNAAGNAFEFGTPSSSAGPAFSAYPTSTQTFSGGFTKLTFGTEEFDTASCYDTSNSRFTPNVEGYYQVNGYWSLPSGTFTGNCCISIYKNGAEHRRGVQPNASFYGIGVNALVYLNGSTDYIEIHGYSGNSVTGGTSGERAYFQAYLARTA